MQNITSKDNQKVKDLIKLRNDSKERSSKSLFYVEGERIVNDTPAVLIDSLYVKQSVKDKYIKLINRINTEKTYILSDEVYDKVKDTVNSQGIIAIVKDNILTKLDINEISKFNKILILDHIQDPGNLGTILRVAEATSFNFIIISDDTCDIYNPKVIRSTMSSIFRISIYKSNNLVKDIEDVKRIGFKTYASTLSDNSNEYNKIKYGDKTALIMGNEGSGISNDVCKVADYNIRIPMAGEIESLNVSIATAILCYEVSNQLK